MTNTTFFFTPLVLMLISDECHDEFFVNLNFLDVPCLKMLIAKALGYLIILGSAIVKVPQIINIVKAGSAEGLSLMSLFADLVGITFTMAYAIHKGFPISTYGENMFMTVQGGILIMLVFHYNDNALGNLAFTPAYALALYALIHPTVLSMGTITTLQSSVLAIIVGSRLMQITTNFMNGGTGTLSVITVVMQFAGCLARVFTTLQETGDMLMATQFIVASALNGAILLQIFWYWNTADKKKTE